MVGPISRWCAIKKPRILVYDIETAPNLAYVWGKYEQNVLAYEKERELLSFAYAWVGEDKVICETREHSKDDETIVAHLAKLLQEADITIAHNGDNFDRKVIKSRMVYWGMKPLKINSSVDTLKVAKSYFSFNGNSLNDLVQHLKIGKKAKTPGFDMWLGCMRGDKKSWALMAKYNKMDVKLLLKLYKRFLPWIENHPSLAKLVDSNGCPTCLSKDVQRSGRRATAQGVSQRMLCMSCGKGYLTRLAKK